MKFKATICVIYQFDKRFIKPQRKFHLKCQTGQLASKVMPIMLALVLVHFYRVFKLHCIRWN